ncbi:MAG: DUF1353 domain-containing protein [Candidatus Competibacteraceae bacterium]|nr:DUF1353 domain-containing protein [Candidatus Competibacteraceae bacterium]
MMNKQAFPDPLIVSYLDGRRWMLQAPFRYIDSKYGAITAPTGFITDYASIPRPGMVHPWLSRTIRACRNPPRSPLCEKAISTRNGG